MILHLFPKDYKKLNINYGNRSIAFSVKSELVDELVLDVPFELRFYTHAVDRTKYHVYKGTRVVRTNYTRVFVDYDQYHTPTPAEIRNETRIARLDKFLA